MAFTRHDPSPRYSALIELYRRLHAEGEVGRGLSAEKTYPGISLLPHVERIKRLISETAADNVLDYGSGKGIAYALPSVEVPGVGHVGSLVDYWEVDYVRCYDPCYPTYARRPDEVFDGVVCTDVLEHCPEEDLEWIMADLFSYARKFVFAVAACFPALTHLPNGENAHCTVQPGQWWHERMERAARGSGVRWQLIAQELVPDQAKGRMLCNTEFNGNG